MTDTPARARARDETGRYAVHFTDEGGINVVDQAGPPALRETVAIIPPGPTDIMTERAQMIADALNRSEDAGVGRDEGIQLLREAEQLFRRYEGEHRARLAAFDGVEPAVREASADIIRGLAEKVERNRTIAERIEAWLVRFDNAPPDKVREVAVAAREGAAALFEPNPDHTEPTSMRRSIHRSHRGEGYPFVD